MTLAHKSGKIDDENMLRPGSEVLWRGFDLGSRVAGDDGDTGIVHEIGATKARIGWDSGISTWTPIADLTIMEG